MPAIVIDIQTVTKAIEAMGIAASVDSAVLFDCLVQEARRNPPQPPPLDHTKKQKLVTAILSSGSGEPTVPDYTSTSGQATLTPAEKAKKQRLVERAKSNFGGKEPVIYISTDDTSKRL